MTQCDRSWDSNDYEGAAVSSTKWRKARIEHICCECHEPIQPGEIYEYVKGYWDGWDSFKTCKTCTTIREEYCPCGWLYGGLRETLWECLEVEL